MNFTRKWLNSPCKLSQEEFNGICLTILVGVLTIVLIVGIIIKETNPHKYTPKYKIIYEVYYSDNNTETKIAYSESGFKWGAKWGRNYLEDIQYANGTIENTTAPIRIISYTEIK
jgi:hypothetical protein